MNTTLSKAMVTATLVAGGLVGIGGMAAQAANSGDDAAGLQAMDAKIDGDSAEADAFRAAALQAATDDAAADNARGCNNSEAVAEALGLTTDELSEARQSGSSLAEIAAAQDVDVDAVVQAIVDGKAERLDAKVEAGDLTEAEAQERLENIEARAAERVAGDSDES